MCNIPKIYNYHFINSCAPAMCPNFSIIVMSRVSFLVCVYINWLKTVPTSNYAVCSAKICFFWAMLCLPIGMAKLLCNCDF